MNTSLILRAGVKYLIPLLMLFSIFLLLRGHNEPGGGFVGGLVAASAFALYSIANGIDKAKLLLKTDPFLLIAIGLIIALLSAMPSVLIGEKFMTGLWFDYIFPVVGKIGTPFLFDVGVYFVVIGIVTKIVFSLAEEEENWK